MRHCDGTDENLTRQVPEAELDRAAMTINTAWRLVAEPGMVVINCQCGKRFDDVGHLVTYPHEAF